MVDLDELDAVLDRLVRFEQTLEARIADVDARVRRVQSIWTGAAADAQLAAHREWQVGAERMRAGLAQLTSVGRTAHANYAAAVRTNASNWAF